MTQGVLRLGMGGEAAVELVRVACERIRGFCGGVFIGRSVSARYLRWRLVGHASRLETKSNHIAERTAAGLGRSVPRERWVVGNDEFTEVLDASTTPLKTRRARPAFLCSRMALFPWVSFWLPRCPSPT